MNAKYGIDPGAVFYTHDSGQYGPVGTKVITATPSEAPYVLDGLHHHAHQTDLIRAEHYSQDRRALHRHRRRDRPCVRPVPPARIRVRAADQGSQRPQAVHDREAGDVSPAGAADRDAVDVAAIVAQWPELARLKRSIEAGTTIPSVILRKLSAAGPGNALSRALRALGRIERTQFTLQWRSDPTLRQRSHAGLNKGEASNALRRAIFFHRQGEIRDRTFENQSFQARGKAC